MKLIYLRLIFFFFITAFSLSELLAQCTPNNIKFLGGQPIYNTACGDNSYQTIRQDVNLSGSGQTYLWQVSFNGAPYSTIINSLNVPITTPELAKNDITSFILSRYNFASGDYRIRRIVDDSSPVCTSTSNTVYLYYAQNQSTISGGTISGTATQCSPANGTLMVSGNTGPVLRWESAPVGTENWTTVKEVDPENYSNTLDYTNLTTSTCYRAVIQNICSNGTTTNPTIYSSTFCITLSSAPVISQLSNQTLCAGSELSLSVSATSLLPLTYQWRKNGVNISGQNSASLNIASVGNQDAGTYDVVVSNSCGSSTSNGAVITVNTLPTVTLPTNFTICAGSVSTATNFSSNPAGATYSWTNSNTAIGLAANGTGNIPSFTAVNDGLTNISATITVTPYLNGCSGPSSSYTITVSPQHKVNTIENIIVCAETVVSSQNPASMPTGASFTWTNSNTSIGLAASGTGNVPNFTAVNTGTSPLSSTITIIPTLNGCSGPAITYTITVNPTPVINGISSQVVCSGTAVAPGNFSGNISGITYSWTNSNTSIGLAASGTGNVPGFTAVNTSAAPVTATITVSPTLNGCSGTPISYTITINPLPQIISAVATNESQCNLSDGSILITAGGTQSLEYSINGGSTYFRNNGNFTGLAAGTYAVMVKNESGCTISGPTLTISSPDAPTQPSLNPYSNGICQGEPLTLSVQNPDPSLSYRWEGPSGFTAMGSSISRFNTDPSMSGIYSVRAILNSCESVARSVNINVNPIPTLTTPQNQTYCEGSSVSEQIISSIPAGAILRWTNSRPEIGLAANGTGNIPAFTASNNTNSPITSVIIISAELNGCTGNNYTFSITINPSPEISKPANLVVCANEIIPSGNLTSTISGTGYTWTNSNTAIGLPASGTGNLPSFKAINTSNSEITSVITVTPNLDGCQGTPVSYTIRVNPLPLIVTATANNETSCGSKDGTITINASGAQPLEYSINGGETFVQNGGSFSGLGAGSYSIVIRSSEGCQTIGPVLSISSPGAPPQPSINAFVSPICEGDNMILSIMNPDPAVIYTWTGPKGFTATGQSIIRPNADISMSGNYAVTAMLNSCVSLAKVFAIKVNQTPTLIAPENMTYCNGTKIPENQLKSTPPGATVSWTNSKPEIGLAASGTGAIPSFNAFNTSDSPITATITLKPSLNGCQGKEYSYTITVNPTPRVNKPLDLMLCSEATSPIVKLSGNIPGLIYTWTNSNTSIGLAAVGSGDIPSFNAVNNSNSIIESVITITPQINGCTGSGTSFKIKVKPLPKLSNNSLSQSICTGSTSKEVILSSTIPGTTFTWTSNAASGLEGNILSGTGNIPAQKLFNNKSTPDLITYTIVPSYDGCEGPATSFTIMVHPLPTATLSGEKTACKGATSTLNVKLTGIAPWSITYTDGNKPVTISRIGSSNFTFNVNANSTRTYRIISVSDALSCTNTGTGTVTIIQPEKAIEAKAASTHISCYGENTGTIEVSSVSGGFGTYEYSINQGETWQNSKKFTGLSAGTYQVYVRDSENKDCITVVAPDILIIQPEKPISPNYNIRHVSCYNNNNGSISINPSGGSAPYSYQWSNGQKSRDINNLTAGIYTLTITDSKGCSFTESIEIKQPDAAIKIAYTKKDASCFGKKDGSIDVTVSGGVLPYNFRWSNNQTIEDIQNLAPNTTYTLTVIDANGCSVSQTIGINEPQLLRGSLSVQNTICKSSTDGIVTAEISGGTKPYNLTWKDLPYKENIIKNLRPGTYELLVSDANGCSITMSSEVFAGNCPPVAINDLLKTDEEIPITGSVADNDFDREKEEISFILLSNAQNGTINFNNKGEFTYTPNIGFWGIENLNYRVCNTSGLCETAVLSIEVIPNTMVNLTPSQSTVSEGKKTTVTARLIRPFRSDVSIKLAYTGTAVNNRDYVLLDQYQEIKIPKGKVITSQKITIAALTDDEKENMENINIKIISTSDPLVRIGSGASVNINDVYPPVNIAPITLNNNLPPNTDIQPDPLLSPNNDGLGNDFFKIENIVSFPENEVLIFNRWGNQVFQIKGYNESDRVFKGYANTGLLSNTNTPLVDGVYYYLITTNRTINGNKITSMNKGYLILKR